MTRVVRVRYEKGVLKPLEPLDLSEGEEVLVEIKENIIEYAKRICKLISSNEEPSEVLSRERERLWTHQQS